MTNFIVLAAGQGQRLRPLTDDRPKCMVEVKGRPMLEWQIATAKATGITHLNVVRGYKADVIDYAGIQYFTNERYETTNMVESLWCAESVFEADFIVSYGDIVYHDNVLESLAQDDHPIAVVIDKEWQGYWERRFENILDDAESLSLDSGGNIRSIGQEPKSVDAIEGQYIGLMAFRREGVDALRELYNRAKNGDMSPFRTQRTFENFYMTDILQALIDTGFPVFAVECNRGWLEVDSQSDLRLAEELASTENGLLSISG